MAVEGDEIHVETDEARGGSTPHRVRWILGISLIGAIVLLSAVWIFGAASQGDTEDEASVSNMIQEAQEESDTDGLVSEGFDELDQAPEAQPALPEGADPALAVPNEAEPGQ